MTGWRYIMMTIRCKTMGTLLGVLCGCTVAVCPVVAGDDTDLKTQVDLLRQQNEQLQRQISQQQQLIENLSRKVAGLESVAQPAPGPSTAPGALGKVLLSGEGGLA